MRCAGACVASTLLALGAQPPRLAGQARCATLPPLLTPQHATAIAPAARRHRPPHMQFPFTRRGVPSNAAVDKRRRRGSFNVRTKQAMSTLVRVALPTILATALGFLYFDDLSLAIRSLLDVGTIRILMADEAQFIQNFLTVIGLLFSILAGNAYAALYEQQEAIYSALSQGVRQGRPSAQTPPPRRAGGPRAAASRARRSRRPSPSSSRPRSSARAAPSTRRPSRT